MTIRQLLLELVIRLMSYNTDRRVLMAPAEGGNLTQRICRRPPEIIQKLKSLMRVAPGLLRRQEE